MTATPSLLAVSGIEKRFGTTHALRGAALELRGGEVHALLGENGAGKSTLIKILVGALRPDAGELRVDGAPVRLDGVGDAIGRGILPIYQQLSLMPHLSVLENLFAFELARGPALGRRDTRRRIGEAHEALRRVGVDVDPRAPLGRLSLAQRQLVEIARAVVRDCRVLLLDEPTTALGVDEVERLFGVVTEMREQGRAVLLISHRLDEVERICDRVTVLRDGRTVLRGGALPGVSRREVIEAMVGHELGEAPERGAASGDELLSVSGLSAPGAFRDVDLAVRAGEVVGIVGLIGSGATELGEALAGERRVNGGAIRIGGRALREGDRRAALRAGVGYIPADRDRDGLFPGLSVLHNASASSLWRLGRGGWLQPARERAELAPLLRRLRVRPEDPDAEIGALSGGNRQKALVARALAGGGRVLVALEPTRGVDVGARREIHDAVLEACTAGRAVVVASTDLDEVMALSHRVLVMRAGRLVAALAPEDGPSAVVRELTGAHA